MVKKRLRYGAVRSALPPEKDVARSSLRFFSAALEGNMLHCVPQAPHNALLRGVRPFQGRVRLPILPTHTQFTKDLLKFTALL